MLHFSPFSTPFGEGAFFWRDERLLKVLLPPVPLADAQKAAEALLEPDEKVRLLSNPYSRSVAELLSALCRGQAEARDVMRLALWPKTTPFADAVLQACSAIPRGETRSYADLARSVGKPRAARAIGNVMAQNCLPLIVPCHRVVKTDGTVGSYGGGARMKRQLLEAEGVDFDGQGRVVAPVYSALVAGAA